LEKWLSEDIEFSASFRGKVEDGFKVFSELVLDKKLNKVFKNPAKISPIEFVMISLLVAVHKDRMSRAQLAGAIGDMRADVRDTHVDIRMNDRVAKTMLDFVRNAKGKAVAGDKGGAAGSGSGEKRKRRSVSDDEDANPKVKKSSTPATPKPPPSAPKNHIVPQNNASTSSTTNPAPNSNASTSASASAAPDRMAALRAAKLATQNSTQNLSHTRIPPPPPLTLGPQSQSQSSNSFQSNGMNFSVSQLPSPGQTFTFPSSLNSPYQPYSQHQLQLQQQQSQLPAPVTSQSPLTSLDMSLMAQMMRSNVTNAAAANPSLSINTNGLHNSHLPPPPRSAPPDRERDRDRDRIPSRTNTRDEDYYSPRDRHPTSSTSSSGFGRRQSDSGWGTRGR
jgi:hypothetical protein